MIVHKLPASAYKVIDEYLNLPLGGKKIACPYYINPKSQRAGLRVLVGKGDPGEIAREVNVIAQLKSVDLTVLNEDEIRLLMQDSHVGIDCSGFLTHILNYWLKNQGDRPLISYVKFENNDLLSKLKRKLRPVEHLGAKLLTNLDNCKEVTEINDIRPGDFIRSKGMRKNSHHIILISEVTLEDERVTELEYVHSIKGYKAENGVRFGKILITDINKSLEDQIWTEVQDSRNWTYEGYTSNLEDNGIRRLKKVNLSFETTSNE
jgi:hypothetical protein